MFYKYTQTHSRKIPKRIIPVDSTSFRTFHTSWGCVLLLIRLTFQLFRMEKVYHFDRQIYVPFNVDAHHIGYHIACSHDNVSISIPKVPKLTDTWFIFLDTFQHKLAKRETTCKSPHISLKNHAKIVHDCSHELVIICIRAVKMIRSKFSCDNFMRVKIGVRKAWPPFFSIYCKHFCSPPVHFHGLLLPMQIHSTKAASCFVIHVFMCVRHYIQNVFMFKIYLAFPGSKAWNYF